jgi:hypothetical protein
MGNNRYSMHRIIIKHRARKIDKVRKIVERNNIKLRIRKVK